MTRASRRTRFGGSKRQTAERNAQPRPAFGLRPWFALLRRARSLRRFAFAIVGGSVPGERGYRPGDRLALQGDGWNSSDVIVASTFGDRLAGMRRPGTPGVLIRASSVHGMTLDVPLRVVHIDLEGTVVRQDVLTPGRCIRAAGPWLLELPIGGRGPAPGSRLVVLPSNQP